jgi:enamine deaminase RidA (YjgF/YER057c/UK114 family)
MGRIEDRLAELGLELPKRFAAPPGIEIRFEFVKTYENLAWISGHGPMDGDKVLMSGKVGDDLSLEQAQEAARLTGLSILASLAEAVNGLDNVSRWLKATGFVNAAPGFNGMPGVINGFTDLIRDLWGERGRHARSSIGVAELPLDWPVEVEAFVEIDGP